MRLKSTGTTIVVIAIALMTAALLLKSQAEQIDIQHVTVNGTETITATLYRPTGAGPFPAVVLLHGCAGTLEKHAAWARSLVEWGYVALVPDSFSTRDVRRLCAAGDDEWARFNVLRRDDARASIEYLQSRTEVDSDHIALLGWSYGGTITLDVLARNPDVQTVGYFAGVAIYPSCWQYLQQHSGTYSSAVPVLILHGADDDWTLPEHCEELVRQAANDVSMHLYDDALHDFDNETQITTRVRNVRLETDNGFGDATIGYNRAAHQAALSDVRKFFSQHRDD